MRGVKRTHLCPERKPFMGLFTMSHWGKRAKLAKRQRERERETDRLIRSHCTFVVFISNAQYVY